MGTGAGKKPSKSVVPNRPSESVTCGRQAASMPKAWHTGSLQQPRRRSKSCVRLALDQSQRNSAPPVSVQTTQASMVPKQSSPAAAASAAAGTFARIQAILPAG